jgi:hypothetical protein
MQARYRADSSVDVILIVDAYHESAYPCEMGGSMAAVGLE